MKVALRKLMQYGNDEQGYAFIYVVWFEDISRKDLCPIHQKDIIVLGIKPPNIYSKIYIGTSDVLQIITKLQILGILK
jgi:hypothetical protein